MISSIIYKIVSENEWNAAEREKRFVGSAIDHQDGYIHFSTMEQVKETAARHFAGHDGLVLVAVDAEALGPALKWEPSRGGALFPHLYEALALDSVKWKVPLPRDASGHHMFPELEA
jgi:uncharacterized protein (DUF952 family)